MRLVAIDYTVARMEFKLVWLQCLRFLYQSRITDRYCWVDEEQIIYMYYWTFLIISQLYYYYFDYYVGTFKYRTSEFKLIFQQWDYVNKNFIYFFTKQFFLVVQRLWYIDASLMIAFVHLQSGHIGLNQSWLRHFQASWHPQ